MLDRSSSPNGAAADRNNVVASPAYADVADGDVVRVLVLTRYSRMGATSRIRFHKMIEAFGPTERCQLSFTIAPLLGDEYLETLYSKGKRSAWYLLRQYLRRAARLLTVGRYDCVWIEKEIFPGAPAFAERLFKLLGVKSIVDFDDATFVYYERNTNPFIRLLMRRKIDRVFQSATVVTAGNQYLAARALEGGAATVLVLPTAVDTQGYAKAAAARRASGKPTIGWIGTPSNAGYLNIYRDAIAQAQQRHGARFVTIGAPANCLEGIEQDMLPWSEQTEVQHLGQWDIGLAPLRPGLWEIGKCGYKVLQCMAAGLPVIASPVGVISEIVQNGKNGYLAVDSAECAAILESLIADPVLRSRIGRAARETVEAKYSVETWRPQLQAAIATAIGRCAVDSAAGRAPGPQPTQLLSERPVLGTSRLMKHSG